MSDDAVSAEERQLAQAVMELAAEFPGVPPERIEQLLRSAAERYDTAAVRTFVPILVAKDVRSRLRADGQGSYLPEQATRASAGALPLQLAAGASG